MKTKVSTRLTRWYFFDKGQSADRRNKPGGDIYMKRGQSEACPRNPPASTKLKGSVHDLDAVGATLVVALLPADAVRGPGDHKGRASKK